MVSWFSALWILLILQRLGELGLARSNAAHLRSLGGYEVGASHYPWLVALHSGFLACLGGEVWLRGGWDIDPQPYFLTLFLLAQILRVWVIYSLGSFWNTRIFVVPGAVPVTRGPYRWMKHPNYLVVTLEFLSFPLAFGAWATAIAFSLGNAFLLRIRIAVEEQALGEAMNYGEKMGDRW